MISSLEQFNAIQQQGTATTAEALTFFDQLEPVDLEFMLGRWRGSEFPTGHPMDGLLTAFNWYGKEFVSPDCVHPLLFTDPNGKIFKTTPQPLIMKLALQFPPPKEEMWRPFYAWLTTLQKTEESPARLRMMAHRQKNSATMIYDHLPIHDVFRKISDSTVLGLMDYKESDRPFFFVLNRESPANRVAYKVEDAAAAPA